MVDLQKIDVLLMLKNCLSATALSTALVLGCESNIIVFAGMQLAYGHHIFLQFLCAIISYFYFSVQALGGLVVGA